MVLKSTSRIATLIALLAVFSSTAAQRTGKLSQKLLLENTIQQRVTNAVSKILDESSFVVDVKVELAFSPDGRAGAFGFRSPSGQPTGFPGSQSDDLTMGQEAQSGFSRDRDQATPFPIPGFPDVTSLQEKEPVRVLDETVAEDMAAAELDELEDVTFDDMPGGASLAGGSADLPTILSLAISIILEDGVSPQTIENVRQVALVASRFDRDRGDILSITTAAFKDRPSGRRGIAAFDDEPSAATLAAQKKSSAVNAELREKLNVVQERNDQLMQEIRDREMEYLQQSEDERKKALSDLADVQNERAKDLIFLQQQREESNLKLQEALLDQIDKLREGLTSGGLSEQEQDIRTLQAQSLEDSLRVYRAAFAKEKERLQAQIEAEATRNEVSQGQGLGGLFGGGQGAILLGILLFFLLLVVILMMAMRNRAPVQPTAMPYATPPYPRRRPRPKGDSRKKQKGAETKKETPTDDKPTEPEKPPVLAAVSEPEANSDGEASVSGNGDAPIEVEEEEWSPEAPGEDPEVIQSELKSIRQSVVSMSVGRQDTATRILSSWLQQDEGTVESSEEAVEDNEDEAIAQKLTKKDEEE